MKVESWMSVGQWEGADQVILFQSWKTCGLFRSSCRFDHSHFVVTCHCLPSCESDLAVTRQGVLLSSDSIVVISCMHDNW